MDTKLREVKIEYATLADLPVIMNIMHKALELVEDKSWYAVDSEEFVGKCIEGQGFTLKALVEGELAGFLTVRYPWMDDDNLGDYIGLSEKEIDFENDIRIKLECNNLDYDEEFLYIYNNDFTYIIR